MSGSANDTFPLDAELALGWRSFWLRIDARGRQNATLLGLLLAVELAGIVFAPLGVYTDPLQGLAALAALGACLAPPTLLALWAVFGSGRFATRLPLAAWLAAVLAVAVSFVVIQVSPSAGTEASVATIGWLLAFIFAQAPLWMIRCLGRWRFVSAPSRAASTGDLARGSQFTLRGLLAWTLAAALPLAALRAILPATSFDVDTLFEIGSFGVIGGALLALAGLPIVPLAWILLAEGRRPILRLVLSGLLLAVLPSGVWLIVDLAAGPDFAVTIPILSGTIANAGLILAVLGACGYRLDRPYALLPRAAESSAVASIAPRKPLSRIRFTVALAPLFGVAVAIVCVVPHQLRQWRQSAVAFDFERSGVSVSFDETGGIIEIDGVNSKLVSDEVLRRIADLKDCEILRVSGGKIDDRRLALLTPLAGLRVLDLSDCEITDAGLGHVARFRNLEELNLANTGVTDAGLKKLHALPKLSSLNLQLTAVTDAGLATLAKLPRLNRLDVSLTAVSIAAAKQFARPNSSFPNSKVIVEYGASDVALSQRLNRRVQFVSPVPGCVAYAFATHPCRLKRLHAHGSQSLATGTATVTDAGLRLLASFADLEELDLHDTAVSDRGLRMLAKLTDLKRLDVRGTKVTEQGVANLARSLPECQIVR